MQMGAAGKVCVDHGRCIERFSHCIDAEYCTGKILR